MIKALMLAWGLQAGVAAASGTPQDPVISTAQRVDRVVDAMTMPGMDVHVVWRPCGEYNASYTDSTHTIKMCLEDLTSPDLAVFMAAHEMGHAIIEQRNVPVPGSEEVAADELGVLGCASADELTAVDSAGLFFAELRENPPVSDDHPDNPRRAYTLMCLADGAEAEPEIPDCAARMHHVANTWERLLGVDWE